MEIKTLDKIDALEDAIAAIEGCEGSSDCDILYVGDNEDTIHILQIMISELKGEVEETSDITKE